MSVPPTQGTSHSTPPGSSAPDEAGGGRPFAEDLPPSAPPGPGDAGEPEWDRLLAAAREAATHAYAPYSNYQVGAAALVDDGRLVSGCNVENAAYGVGLCAECGLVSALHATGGGRLTSLACVGPTGEPIMPCGRCRQLLWENGGPELVLLTPEGPLPMAAVLPQAFGFEDLQRAAEARDVAPGRATSR